MLLLIGWICGNAGVALPWGSYGVAPFNLAAPWYPQLSGLFAPARMIDPTGYHYDAYNNWGAGFLFAAVAGAIIAVRLLSARHVGRIPSSPESAATLDSSAAPPPFNTTANASATLRHAPLALVLWLLTIYAVGYDVYWIDVPVAGIRAADVMASFNRADGITSIIGLLRAHAGSLVAYMALHWLAAQGTLPTNSVYQARADDRVGCDALYGRGLPPPAADALTIYVDVAGFPTTAASVLALDPRCRRVADLLACFTGQ